MKYSYLHMRNDILTFASQLIFHANSESQYYLCFYNIDDYSVHYVSTFGSIAITSCLLIIHKLITACCKKEL